MPLPQDISPVNSELVDALTRSTKMDWIETKPGSAYIKILWFSSETGRWAVLFRWLKGHVARPHKHLSAAQAFILSGKLQVRDTTYEAGDFLIEQNGMVHGATTALEDTEYLFICDGPILYFDEDGFTDYLGWEQLSRMQEAANSEKAAAE
jgi:gentisate 1,2-dioxygenase